MMKCLSIQCLQTNVENMYHYNKEIHICTSLQGISQLQYLNAQKEILVHKNVGIPWQLNLKFTTCMSDTR